MNQRIQIAPLFYINLSEPFESAVARLKNYYGEKANQGMVEHLVRAEAIRLDLWDGFSTVRDPHAGGVWPWADEDAHSKETTN